MNLVDTLPHYFQADSSTEFFASPWNKNCFKKCSSILSLFSHPPYCGLPIPDMLGASLLYGYHAGSLSKSRHHLHRDFCKLILLTVSLLKALAQLG